MTTKPKDYWVQLGRELAQKLDGITNEAEISSLISTLAVEPDNKHAIEVLRKQIKAKFPRVEISEVMPDGYYRTNAGVNMGNRYEHLALKFLNKSHLKKETSETSEKPTQKATTKPIKPTKPEPELTTKMLETAVIDALELDKETKEILGLALSHSGLDLAEFMQKAIKTYANTITGKIRRLEEDSLEDISTEELLDNPKYSTYPGRAEEMVRRAINAIKIYNSEVATEPKQRWIITQSLLSELTGSRGSVVQLAMQKYRDDIDSHHDKYPEFFNDDGTLKQYFNRKRGVEIKDEIGLVKLVPNG
jgi:hypothetical protein